MVSANSPLCMAIDVAIGAGHSSSRNRRCMATLQELAAAIRQVGLRRQDLEEGLHVHL